MILECRNLCYHYPRSDERVFRNLSFDLPDNGFHALFGPSGVGKTTLARLLTGDIRGHTGDITRSRTDGFLYTYNQERLPGWAPVGTHLERITPKKSRALQKELVSVFGMTDYMTQRFSQLSLGQQNRVNLIRYLLQPFDLLVMDESLANVDEKSKQTIITAIKSIFPKRTFLYISHNLMEVARFCSTILVLLKAGRTPQMIQVRGLDQTTTDLPDKTRMDQVLLEIMNAC